MEIRSKRNGILRKIQLTPNRTASFFFLQGLSSRQWDGAGSRGTETIHMDRQQAETDTLWVCISHSLLPTLQMAKENSIHAKSCLMKIAEVSPVPANTLADQSYVLEEANNLLNPLMHISNMIY